MTFKFQHITPFFIYGKGNLTAPAVHSTNIGTRNANHKALIEAALWYGKWYYSGTIMDSNGLKEFHCPNCPEHNINNLSGKQNMLEVAWTCVICLHTESDTTSPLHKLGFEAYYIRKGNTLFKYSQVNTYTHAKIVLKENTIFTFFPTNTRWTTTQIQIGCVEDPTLAIILIQKNDVISQNKWLASELSGKYPTYCQSNLVEDHMKLLKILEEWTLLAFNPIVLYKPPYLHDQDHIKTYLGQATICKTMESMWPRSNPTPPPLAVPVMLQTTHTRPFPDNANMMTSDGLVWDLSLMTHTTPTMSAQKQSFWMMMPQHMPQSTTPMQAKAVNTIPVATASVVATAVASDQMSQMHQLQPQCLQQQYSNNSYTTYTGSQ